MQFKSKPVCTIVYYKIFYFIIFYTIDLNVWSLRLQAAPEPSGAVEGVGAEEGVGVEAEDDSGSEDDGIGPKPPKPGEGGSVLLSQVYVYYVTDYF